MRFPTSLRGQKVQVYMTLYCVLYACAAPNTIPLFFITSDYSTMTSLSTKLAEREAAGKPIQVGLIGAGKFGSML